MKLPRWLVVVMLVSSAVVIIATGALWWVSWPTRTIHEFTTLLEQGRFDDANQFLRPPARLQIDSTETREKVVVEGGMKLTFTMVPSQVYSPESWRSWCTIENLQTESRSVADIACGRQQFGFHRQFTTPVFVGGYAERGNIVLRYENWAAQP